MKTFFAIFILSLSLVLTGCPSGSGIQKSAQAADKLPALTDSVITAVGGAYDAGVITLAQKDKFVTTAQKVISGGRALDNAIKAAQAAKDTSPATVATLNALFSTGVVTPFLQILEDLKLLPPDKAATVIAAINLVRTAILTISSAFTQAGYHTGAEVLNERYA